MIWFVSIIANVMGMLFEGNFAAVLVETGSEDKRKGQRLFQAHRVEDSGGVATLIYPEQQLLGNPERTKNTQDSGGVELHLPRAATLGNPERTKKTQDSGGVELHLPRVATLGPPAERTHKTLEESNSI